MNGDEWMLLLPQILIGFLSWLQVMTSMNRLRRTSLIEIEGAWSLMLYIHRSVFFWISALSVNRAPFAFQLLLALVARIASFIGFVIVFNRGFYLPTRQQWLSFAVSILITIGWEINHRLVATLED
jgi:hypothetical protein